MSYSYEVFTPDGEAAGALSAERRGIRASFEYTSDRVFPPSRLVLVTTDTAVSLGVPVPRGGGMYLSKTVTLHALGGIDPEKPLKPVLADITLDPSSLIKPIASPEPKKPAPPPEPEKPPAPQPEPEKPSDPHPEPENPSVFCLEPEKPSDPHPEPEPPATPCPEPDKPAAPYPELDKPAAPCPEPDTPASCPAPEPPVTLPAEPVAPEPSSAWRPEADPDKYFSDPALRAACRRCRGVLSRRVNGEIILAFPYSPSEPFPMLPIFRDGSLANIDGSDYITFKAGDPGTC